ncbi:MAG: replication restart DNA helicase PriA [Magnetococcales bacterium]|nr:replication restart DNA helicase PriA [Magnetococcales bacterium]HIJ83288.1 primosomal protein N' [Magnetococcales bacterium]
MYVEIALPIPMRTLFTYALPETLAHCQPGMLALVPVGRTQRVGVVWRILEQPHWTQGTIRPIHDLLTPDPLFDADLLYLLDWISRYYMRPLGNVVAVAMPSHLRFEPHHRVIWLGRANPTKPEWEPLITYLEKQKSMALSTLTRHFGSKNLLKNVHFLEKQGIIRLETSYRPRYPRESQIHSWTNFSQGSPQAASVNHLNQEQQRCVDYLTGALNTRSFRAFLLEGVTGSGKTEVYFRVVESCLQRGRQVLLLVPEIGLTPQLVQRYLQRFKTEVAVFHSGMNSRQRFDAWQKLRSGQARVVIGARSAIFAPFVDLGLIVVDEEHDSSYKQEGGVPYHGRDMAVVRAQKAEALLILGSATPSMESLHNAHLGRFTHLKLNHRATGAPLPTIRTIHLGRQENQRTGAKNALISLPLEQALRHTLEQGLQGLLFLNRRGWAPSLLCRRCGHAVMCPNCSVTLTYHDKRSQLICHYCDHRQSPMDVCPDCGQLSLFFFGPGTEQLEKETRHCFPQARVARLDRDTVSSKEVDLETTLTAFQEGQLDILVGTQMIAKGHHFPRLALVGVVLAESSLWQPDFRAAERTCQLLTQVAGRAGREETDGQVLIQTFDPAHYALRAVVQKDGSGFAQHEMALRQEIGYPPFQRLALLRFSSINQADGENYCRVLANNLPVSNQATLLGPAPSPLFKLRNRYRWQLLIKENPGEKLHGFLAHLLKTAESLATKAIRIDLDVDPHSFL